jgi:hypothetical protein
MSNIKLQIFAVRRYAEDFLPVFTPPHPDPLPPGERDDEILSSLQNNTKDGNPNQSWVVRSSCGIGSFLLKIFFLRHAKTMLAGPEKT